MHCRHSRALHSAIFSAIGAIGFLASAVLPPQAYSVRTRYDPDPKQKFAELTGHLATVRMSHRGGMWRVLVHSSPAGLAVLQSAQHGCHRFGHRSQHLHGSSRADRWRVDLQGRRGHTGVSHWPLDQCRLIVLCRSGLRSHAFLLFLEE